MDLLWLALDESLSQQAFESRVMAVWAKESAQRPCALLLNHPLVLSEDRWRALLLQTIELTSPSPSLGSEALRQERRTMLGHIELKQIASSCVCCAPQGHVGLLLAGMFRRLLSLSKQVSSLPGTVAVLLVGSAALQESNLRRSIRYLQPPPRLQRVF